MKLKTIFHVLIISGFIVLFSCDKKSSNAQYSNTVQKNRPPNAVKAPDFTLVSLEGDMFTLSDLRGKVILLNFWATWCYPCKIEIPDLNKLQEKYQAAILMITHDMGVIAEVADRVAVMYAGALHGQFTPGSYIPLRFTFLIWVMVIIGGSGNNLGSIIGAFITWFVWIEAEPTSLWLV